MRDYGKLAKHLTQLLKKDRFGWTSEATNAFEALKTAMTSPPVLALPDFSKPFTIETDVSGNGIEAVLMQQGHPIAYLSKALSPTNSLLSAYERELLAVIHAVQKWSAYLVLQPFIVRTDQQSLKHLLENKVSTPLQQKWLSKLPGYDFEIQYKKGSENHAANALSRVEYSDQILMSISMVQSPLYDQIAHTWKTDPNMLQLI